MWQEAVRQEEVGAGDAECAMYTFFTVHTESLEEMASHTETVGVSLCTGRMHCTVYTGRGEQERKVKEWREKGFYILGGGGGGEIWR